MLKNKLSGREQEIYFTLSNKTNRIFTVQMLKGFRFSGNATLLESLARMAKKGWIIRLKRGTYYLSEPGQKTPDDVFKLAPYVYNGYLAFSSALYIYNAFTERPYTVYVATRTRSKSTVVGGTEIRAVALRRRAVGMTKYKDYVISTKAKTLYDCFHQPEYAGGYSRVLASISGLKMGGADWKEFIQYVKTFDRASSKRKIGYMLEVANQASNCVPVKVIKNFKAKGPVIKLGAGQHGKYDHEWRIVDYLGKGYLLGWSR